MRILRMCLLLLLMGVLVACGSVATPTAPESAEAIKEVEQPEESVEVELEEPEEVIEVETEEPEEVVEVATEEPEVTDTEEPENEVATDTEEATDEPMAVSTSEDVVDEGVSSEPLDFSDNPLIMLSNPENGLALFGEFHDSIGYACSTCHLVDTERKLIGPGLWNIASRAQTRVDGQDAVEYLFNSIAHPNDYMVEGYPEDLMPQNWTEIYSTAEIYDIISYLLTLQG